MNKVWYYLCTGLATKDDGLEMGVPGPVVLTAAGFAGYVTSSGAAGNARLYLSTSQDGTLPYGLQENAIGLVFAWVTAGSTSLVHFSIPTALTLEATQKLYLHYLAATDCSINGLVTLTIQPAKWGGSDLPAPL